MRLLVILLSALVVFLSFLLLRKHQADLSKEQLQLSLLQRDIEDTNRQKAYLEDTVAQTKEQIEQAQEHYRKVIQENNENALKQREQLEHDYNLLREAKGELYKRDIVSLKNYADEVIAGLAYQEEEFIKGNELINEGIEKDIAERKKMCEAVIEPMRNLERERMERLFYCIQISDEDKEDIRFLLDKVAPQIRNKNIIPKLVWSEYVQKPCQELMKRCEIKDNPGIYKITNLETNKCYIGKSTKVRQRLIDHIKGALGISSIGYQKIHTEMEKQGIWNWTFELIEYCDKELLNSKEKNYIDFFKSNEYGYNVTKGGEG